MAFVSIGRGFRLETTAARQFELWNWAHFQRFGFDFDLNWATRDSADQVRMLVKYYRRVSYRTGLYWDGAYWSKKPGSTVTVAKPGTSPHERGVAVDIAWKSAAEREWAHDTASVYGFAFNVARENWHAALVGRARITSGKRRPLGLGSSNAPSQGSAPVSATPAPATPSTPAPPTPVEDIMLKPFPHLIVTDRPVNNTPAGAVYVVTRDSVDHVTAGQLNMLTGRFELDKRATTDGGDIVKLTGDDITAYAALFDIDRFEFRAGNHWSRGSAS